MWPSDVVAWPSGVVFNSNLTITEINIFSFSFSFTFSPLKPNHSKGSKQFSNFKLFFKKNRKLFEELNLAEGNG